jgi:hypothetical protein
MRFFVYDLRLADRATLTGSINQPRLNGRSVRSGKAHRFELTPRTSVESEIVFSSWDIT